MTQTALSCRSEEVVASDFQRRITHAVRAEQLEPVPSAAARGLAGVMQTSESASDSHFVVLLLLQIPVEY
jgi:hypothetical protein